MALKPRSPRRISPAAAAAGSPKRPELLYYGQHICETLGNRRRQDIVRVYCIDELLPQFGELLRWCAAQRKAYHVVTSSELQRITGSVHHEGVAILALAPQHGNAQQLHERLAKNSSAFILLDGVQNPHNVGTIMRVMAHFGWPLLAARQDFAPLTAAAARMSEGGAEFVETFALDRPVEFLTSLRQQGYRIVGTSSHAKASLYDRPMNAKVCLVMGHEVHGVSAEIESLFDDALMIPGTGAVESLNVAVATGLMLGEYTRLHGVGARLDKAAAGPRS